MLYIVNNSLKVTVAIRLGILFALLSYAANFAMNSNERLSRHWSYRGGAYSISTESRFILSL